MANEDYNTLEDLVFSRSFRNWVLNKRCPEAEFWTNWVARNPDKTETITQAKAVIHALQLNLPPLPDSTTDAEVRKVLEKLRDGRVNLVREIPFRPALVGRRHVLAWTVAACIAFIAIITWAVRFYLHQQDGYDVFLAGAAEKQIHRTIADSGGQTRITLPDKSTVRLSRGSRLSWPEGLQAAGANRIVFLEGEAAFDIVPHAPHPFFVYTRPLIAKVLGTSFIINTTRSRSTISVTAGKLSVFHRLDLSDGIILTPNQQIVFSPGEEDLKKTLVTSPQSLDANAADLRFDSTSAVTVFRQLQKQYGIPIVFDEEALSRRCISATLGKETFYEKLRIICREINATFEVVDGSIVIAVHDRFSSSGKE